MLRNYDKLVEKNHSPNWHFIPDYHQSVLIIDDSGSGKTNVLLILKNISDHIFTKFTKIHSNQSTKYQLLIKRRDKVGIKKLKNPKALIDYSLTIDNVYEDLGNYKPTQKRKVFIVYDDMIANIEKFSYLQSLVFKRKKTQHFTCFYITIYNLISEYLRL